VRRTLKYVAWTLITLVIVALAAWFWAYRVATGRYEKQWTVHTVDFPIPFLQDEQPPTVAETWRMLRNAAADAGIRTSDIDGMLSYSNNDSTSATFMAGDIGARLNFYMDCIGGGSSTEALIGIAIGVMEAGLCKCVAIFRAMNGFSQVRIGGTERGGVAHPRGGDEWLAQPRAVVSQEAREPRIVSQDGGDLFGRAGEGWDTTGVNALGHSAPRSQVYQGGDRALQGRRIAPFAKNPSRDRDALIVNGLSGSRSINAFVHLRELFESHVPDDRREQQFSRLAKSWHAPARDSDCSKDLALRRQTSVGA
jgi:hypothetical protein